MSEQRLLIAHGYDRITYPGSNSFAIRDGYLHITSAEKKRIAVYAPGAWSYASLMAPPAEPLPPEPNETEPEPTEESTPLPSFKSRPWWRRL